MNYLHADMRDQRDLSSGYQPVLVSLAQSVALCAQASANVVLAPMSLAGSKTEYLRDLRDLRDSYLR